MKTTKVTHISKIKASNKCAEFNLSEKEVSAISMDCDFTKKAGITISDSCQKAYRSVAGTSEDSGGSVGTPTQFLQAFLPGVIHEILQARSIDRLLSVVTIGDFTTNEIVMKLMTHTGKASAYSDTGSINLTSFTTKYEYSKVARFWIGFAVNLLESEQTAKESINAGAEKRNASNTVLQITRNDIMFNGNDNGEDKVYGMLNNPNLPAYVDATTGASGKTTFASKTVAERKSDILTVVASLRKSAGSNIRIKSDPMILGVPSDIIDLFDEEDATKSDGRSLATWMTKTYPNITVEEVPEFNKAHGGKNVMYLYPPRVSAEIAGTTNGLTMFQAVPTKFRSLNVVQTMTGQEEGVAVALAGTIVQYPAFIQRVSGV